MKKSLIHPISIDMGGKYTGVYITQYTEERDNPVSTVGNELSGRIESGAGFLISYPDSNSNNPIFVQTARRLARSAIKAKKRRKQSKRFLMLTP